MKTTASIILKFWLINICTIVVLYFGYRIYISQIDKPTESTLEGIGSIFEILLHLGFSLLFIIGLLLASLTIFLNYFDKILQNRIYSGLTFLILPILAILVFNTMFYIDNIPLLDTITAPFNIFFTIYLLILFAEFAIFRKQIDLVIQNK